MSAVCKDCGVSNETAMGCACAAPVETDEAKQERATQCGKELEALLLKWNCNLDIGMRVFAGRNEPIVNIVPK